MTIGIIGAMDEEIAVLRANMMNTKETIVANTLFIEGQMFDKHVVLLKSGIGKVNAAMATSILHERFAPESVINTGSAGGFAQVLDVDRKSTRLNSSHVAISYAVFCLT